MANIITKEQYDSIFGDITYDEFLEQMESRINISSFNDVYTAVTTQLLSKKIDGDDNSFNGLFESILVKFNQEFDGGGYTNEQIVIAKSQFFANAYNTLETQASNSSFAILNSWVQRETVVANKELVQREKEGFNDSLRSKQAEFNGQVAAFAVNANSSNMQAVVSRFNLSIDALIQD